MHERTLLRLNPEPLDAFGVGVSFSISLQSPIASIEGNIGLEEVVDLDTDRMTTFFVVGGDVSLGGDKGFVDFIKDTWETDKFIPRVSANIYGAAIHNVDDPVANYSGQFVYNTTTAAHEIGATWGEAHSPGDPDRQLAYSETAGLTVSTTALTKNAGTNFYVPVVTVDPFRFDIDFP